MRIVSILLLLITFFLSGVVYGMSSQDAGSAPIQKESEESIETEEVAGGQLEKTVYPSPYKQIDEDQPTSIIERIASGLEVIVNIFYEVVVNTLHSFSEQFF